VAPSKTRDLQQRFVEPGWLLVTCSGNIGDVIVTYRPHDGIVLSHDVLRMEIRDEQRRGYVYAFLRSKFGRGMLRSAKYGSIIKHLEPEHLQEVPIPGVPVSVQIDLATRVAQAFRLRDDAYQSTLDAEQRYGDLIADFVTAMPPSFSVSLAAIAGGRRRLDAYRYNPVAQSIEDVVRSLGEPTTLGSVAQIVLPNRFARIPLAGGMPYVDSEDIFKINPELTKHIRGTRVAFKAYMVTAGQILVARSGQTYGLNGSVMLANQGHENKIISEDIIRVTPRDIRPGYLALALGHPRLGRPLILRLAFGSSVPHIAPEDLATVPIARLGDAEDALADSIERASALRMEADQLEDEAVEIVECEIERQLHS
jgi:hypothetical protein